MQRAVLCSAGATYPVYSCVCNRAKCYGTLLIRSGSFQDNILLLVLLNIHWYVMINTKATVYSYMLACNALKLLVVHVLSKELGCIVEIIGVGV